MEESELRVPEAEEREDDELSLVLVSPDHARLEPLDGTKSWDASLELSTVCFCVNMCLRSCLANGIFFSTSLRQRIYIYTYIHLSFPTMTIPYIGFA